MGIRGNSLPLWVRSKEIILSLILASFLALTGCQTRSGDGDGGGNPEATSSGSTRAIVQHYLQTQYGAVKVTKWHPEKPTYAATFFSPGGKFDRKNSDGYTIDRAIDKKASAAELRDQLAQGIDDIELKSVQEGVSQGVDFDYLRNGQRVYVYMELDVIGGKVTRVGKTDILVGARSRE